MNRYLVTMGHGLRRNVIACNPFSAIRTALETLTIDEQSQIIILNIRIKCEPMELRHVSA